MASLLAATTLGVLVLIQPPGAAHAVPAHCDRPAVATVGGTGTPWAQQRYGTANLAGVADGRGITVAVIDSGVDAAYPQLRGRVVAGIDLLDRGDGRIDCVGHGTAVASIIAAAPSPANGFAGLAPGATILPVRVTERSAADPGSTDRTVGAGDLARAVRGSVDRGASVINLSVVVYEDSPALRAAVAYAERRDAVVVAAVGNQHDRGDPTPYPAAYPGVIAVGAISPSGMRVPTSQVGPYVDLVAPGADVLAAAPPRGYGLYEGTSFAVPFVSATAALLRQYRPDLTAAQVSARLAATADPAAGSGRAEEYGAGELDPYRAVTDSLPDPTTHAVPAATLPRPAPRPRVPVPDGATLRLAAASALLALIITAVAMTVRRRSPAEAGTVGRSPIEAGSEAHPSDGTGTDGHPTADGGSDGRG